MKYPLIKPKYYFSLFKEVADFIKNPTVAEAHEKSRRQKIYDTFGLFILKLVLLIPVVLFFAVVYDPENIQSGNMSERLSPLFLLVVGGFILPFLEEVAFRLSLRFKPVYLALSATVLCYYILTKLVFQSKMSAVDDSFVIRFVSSLLLGLVLFPFVNIETIKVQLTQFWATNFRWIYYISCLFFAWIHISKYEINWTHLLLLPILTLPQLFSAIIYGYIRVTFGFQYPLLFHMTNNIVAISVSFLPFSDLLMW